MRDFGKITLRVLLAAVVALTLGLATGCSRDERPPASQRSAAPTEPAAPAPKAQTARVLVYFTRGEYLGVAGREVSALDDAGSRMEYAMTALLQGPTAQDTQYGLGTVIPAGTTLNGVTLEGSKATVDLSRQFESGGGSLSMLLRVAQVVYTLTQFESVSEVAFKLDGQPVEAIGGEGVIVSPGATRADFEGQAPAILVERPVPGEELTSTVPLGGSANVFEAQFTVEVENATGEVVSTTPVMATSGTGTRGTFEAEAFSYGSWAPGAYTVVFFDTSPKDGSKTNVVEIPVTIAK